MPMVLTNENLMSISCIGSALEADKNTNLALKISVIVYALETPLATTQRRPLDVRGDGLSFTSGLSLAQPVGHLWIVELGLYALATLVSEWLVGKIAAGAGAESPWQAAFFRRQPYQDPSGCEQSCRRPAKSGNGTHQERCEYQAQCLGGWPRTGGQFEPGSRTIRRRAGNERRDASAIARNDDRGRQGLRHRRFPGTVAAMGKPSLHSTPLQPAPACPLASWSLPTTTQGRGLVPTIETPSQGGDAL